MKKILLVIFAFMPVVLNAQIKVKYSTTLSAPGKSATDLFHMVKKWCISDMLDEPMNTIVASDLYEDEGIVYYRSSESFDFDSKVSNVTKRVSKIPIVGKKFNVVNDLSNTGLNGTLTGDFVFSVKNGELTIVATNFIHNSAMEGTTGTLSQGLIYEEMPSELFITDKAKYKAMLLKALPVIKQWWDETVNSVNEKLK